ncbi:MAG: hypothetical protein GY750_09865 [Lentisphaerae bacterium]|nr:hypothetical protein [Lentisphaerota bacterium]
MSNYIKTYSSYREDGACLLNSLASAIIRYINKRTILVEKANRTGKRWVKYSGAIKLFSANTTKKNVRIMKQIQSIIFDEKYTFCQKFEMIKLLEKQLSRRGKARKLIDFFISETCHGKKILELKNGDFILNGSYYKFAMSKKGGINGDVLFFKHANNLSNKIKNIEPAPGFVRKTVLSGAQAMEAYDINDLVYSVDQEVELFNKAYKNLGQQFFSIAEASKIRTKEDLHIIMPQIPGISLEELVMGKRLGSIVNYHDDENSIFQSIFFKLRELFNINISHGDLNIGNIMIVNSFLEIFFIDFGEAISWTDEQRKSSLNKNILLDKISNSIMSDIARVIYNIFLCRHICGRKNKFTFHRSRTVSDIIDEYYLRQIFENFRISWEKIPKKVNFERSRFKNIDNVLPIPKK